MQSYGAPARVLVGVCAYNEEHNISKLLKNLLTKQSLSNDSKILVVCSGCTDGTPMIVEEWCKKDPRVKLIDEKKRKGKANALNKIFEKAKEFADTLILVNADALPTIGSIKKLLIYLENQHIGAVFARPVPLNEEIGISNRIVHIVWKLHHSISSCKTPKFSAELCAVRSICLKSIPEEIATDEPYIELAIRQQGFSIQYAPEATIHIRCPTDLNDLYKQRKRIWIGHLQIRKMAGIVVSTSSIRNILSTVSTLGIREIPYVLTGAILEVLAYLTARFNHSKGKIPFAWEPISSTKTAESA